MVCRAARYRWVRLKQTCICAALLALVIESCTAPAAAMFEVQWFPSDGTVCEYAVRWDFRYDNGTTYNDTLFRVYNDTGASVNSQILVYTEEAESHIRALQGIPSFVLLADHVLVSIKNTYSDGQPGNITRHLTVTAGNLTFENIIVNFIIYFNDTSRGYSYNPPSDDNLAKNTFISSLTRFSDYFNNSLQLGEPVVQLFYNGSVPEAIPRVANRTADTIVASSNYTFSTPHGPKTTGQIYVGDLSGQVLRYQIDEYDPTTGVSLVSYSYLRQVAPVRDFTGIIAGVIGGGAAIGIVAVVMAKRRKIRS
nr:hypothetical protein [Candidatus Sigynarchaeota archaeon]